ncbi:MAG TPA: FtsX-like permease family protein [Sphingobacterium sp.]|nr:FtsX-like permease family protein [Sphingobacterium sp.]
MKVPLLFAVRYLFSKKSVNAINIISSISVIGVFVSTAALVIVLSFYNGMEKFILSMYSSFTPDLRIEPRKGKLFDGDTAAFEVLRNDPAIRSYSEIIEDKILIQYDNQQYIGVIKGVSPESLDNYNSADVLQAGQYYIQSDSADFALIGAQIQANLKVPITGFYNNIQLYSPRKDISISNINPLEDFNIRSIDVVGVLTYQPEFDDLILAPIDYVRDLLGEGRAVSAVEIYLKDPNATNRVRRLIQEALGDDFLIKNRQQQNPTLYKTIKSEKWIVFFILTFIGIIAIFNIVGSLTMLVIDKKEDMKILQSLGAERRMIERIFFIEGIFIALMGGVIGIVVGYIFCKLQDMYGFIRTGAEDGSLIDVYPIDIRVNDFALVFATVVILSLIVSYFSSKLSVQEIGKVTDITKE